MTSAPAASLGTLLTFEKKLYLEGAQTNGGTAEGFRNRIRRQYEEEPLKFNSRVLDALMEAATKKWQAPPRKKGPDLFSIGGLIIPETLTRPSRGVILSGEDLEGDDEEELFEKIDHNFATVNDLFEDATIKLRKAAQAGTAAERRMQAYDEARRRARKNMSAFLKDLADKS
jgi:hypothetical protein